MDSYERSGSFVLYNWVLHPVWIAFLACILTAPYSRLLPLVLVLVLVLLSASSPSPPSSPTPSSTFSTLSPSLYSFFLCFFFFFFFYFFLLPSSSSLLPLLFFLVSSSFLPLPSSVTAHEANGSDSSGDQIGLASLFPIGSYLQGMGIIDG